jgi:hypothetical protein
LNAAAVQTWHEKKIVTTNPTYHTDEMRVSKWDKYIIEPTVILAATAI